MSDEVRIVTSRRYTILARGLIDKAIFEEENEKSWPQVENQQALRQVVFGITRRALYTDSWLSAASFEQTTRCFDRRIASGAKIRLASWT